MTLGEQIQRLRREQTLSQEELGAEIGVSRQAVSKWETGQALPDTGNLLAMAELFHVSADALAGLKCPESAQEPPAQAEPDVSAPPDAPAPHPPSRRRAALLWIAAALAVCLLAIALHSLRESISPPPAASSAASSEGETQAAALPETEFLLRWDGGGEKSYLTLGAQEELFPFGTDLFLTKPEEVTDTDYSGTTGHWADCGALWVEYLHMDADASAGSDASPRESVTRISTVVPNYTTPRGVGVGSTKAEVLAAYGDDLVYCLKEEGGYTLLRHEYYYAYQTEESLGASLRFFMRDGLVAGVSLEDMMEFGSEAFAPNDISRFPLKDGEPDFSNRREPEYETLSDTRKVYIAWNKLVTDNNLSAEERYAYRRDVFSLLPYMDWGELGRMGSLGEEWGTIEALMDWLARQEAYSSSEILWIQMGCTAKGLDGAYTDSYCWILSSAFFYDPAAFAKCLAVDGLDQDTVYQAIRHTAYDAELYPNELRGALETLDTALSGSAFSDAEAGWARLLKLYLTTPIDDRNDLPKTPAELDAAG